MIKVPFTKSGDVRYFELFKITLLTGLLLMVFSLFLEHTPTFNAMPEVIASTVYFLVAAQFIILSREELVQLITLIESSILRPIQLFIPIILIPVEYLTGLLNDVRQALHIRQLLCVSRC